MKTTKVKKHLAKKKKGGMKSVRTHVRKTKTASDKEGAGGAILAKGGAATPALPGKVATGKSAMAARMAALRAMRGKKKKK